VVGIKPARGRVSAAPYAGFGWAGFATSGPMARTVADVALGLDVLAGPASGDPWPTPLPERSFASAVGETPPQLRIGWTTSNPATSVNAEVADAVARTADALRAMGHELVESAPDTSGMWAPFLRVVSAYIAALPLPDPDLLGPHPRATYDEGQRLSAADYLRTEAEIYQLTRRVLAWFDEFDVLLCPTLPRVAPPLGELLGAGREVWDKLERFIPFTFWGNMTGQPAISLPLGWSAAGLPIGVQLVGRQLAERALLSLAARLEQAMPWADRRPAIAGT
jgi:Asp-tRNA(Asn)/Glu-tRNA(Gln) amidotransferase A subunit family amidase